MVTEDADQWTIDGLISGMEVYSVPMWLELRVPFTAVDASTELDIT
jgi:hypothetical protein